MPKQIVPPAPAYGSPEWKAEQTRMVGTPEWKAANNYKAPASNTSDPMARGVYFESALPFAPHGTTQTTAEKQAQSPLYNPLYDPRSAEYKANLVQASNPSPRVRMPNAVNQSNFSQPFQNQNQSIPAYTPPTGPENPTQTPQITLPQMFQQQFGNPNPLTAAPAGVTMPDLNKNRKSGGFGGNWNDLLSVAYNR